MSGVKYYVSSVIFLVIFIKKNYKVVKVVGGVSVINDAYPVKFFLYEWGKPLVKCHLSLLLFLITCIVSCSHALLVQVLMEHKALITNKPFIKIIIIINISGLNVHKNKHFVLYRN